MIERQDSVEMHSIHLREFIRLAFAIFVYHSGLMTSNLLCQLVSAKILLLDAHVAPALARGSPLRLIIV